MKVKLIQHMTGLRGGVDWPPVGTEFEVDDEEGRHLCHNGTVVPVVEDRTEKAVAQSAEKRTAATRTKK